MEALLSLVMEGSVWLISRLSRGKVPELVAILFVGVGACAIPNLLFTLGPTITLTCTREDTADVFCRFNSQIFVLGGSTGGILRVQEAVNERKCIESSCTYRVVLQTTDGKYPLTDDYTSGSKAAFVDRLNSFIADKSQTKIELTQSPDLSGLLPPGLVIVVLALLVWGYQMRRKRFQHQV